VRLLHGGGPTGGPRGAASGVMAPGCEEHGPIPCASDPLLTLVPEKLSEKVLSGILIAHLVGTQRQNQGHFVPFLDS
jgi:hypothetical protein